MQKNYIFKTKDGTQEISIKGNTGLHKMGELEKAKQTTGISYGGIVTAIATTFETKEELQKALDV